MTKANLRHPVRSLPPAMQSYLRIPKIAFALWAVAAIGIVSFRYFVPVNILANTAEESAAGGIKVKGAANIQIKEKDKGVRVYLDDQRYKLERDGDEIELNLPESSVRYRLKRKPDKANIYAPDNTVIYEIRTEDDGDITLDANGGRQLYRIKIKDGSYNIYDGAQVRILKGKPKPDSINVKTVPGDERVLKIEGTTDLREAAMLSLPIESPYRVLAWAHARK